MHGYEAVRKTSGWMDRSAEGRLRVAGPDRTAWLQGLLTNDIAALRPGTGCYAAYLTPQGRMIADVRVLARDGQLWLDVPASQRTAVFDRLSTFIIMEDVTIEDVTESVARLSVHGPAAAAVVAAAVEMGSVGPAADAEAASNAGRSADAGAAAHADRLAALPEHASVEAKFRGQPVLIAGSREIGAIGFDLYVPVAAKADLSAALAAGSPEASGAESIDVEAWQALRIEAGRPLFGVDMTTETIPLEAGIEDRAISFTKGCYVGQEIIIRVMHRGGGRVAKKLVRLQPAVAGESADGSIAGETATSDPALPSVASSSPGLAPEAQAPIVSGEKTIGQVTSATWSPRAGHWLALGYVHRDFAEPGTAVTVGGTAAVVSAPSGAPGSDLAPL